MLRKTAGLLFIILSIILIAAGCSDNEVYQPVLQPPPAIDPVVVDEPALVDNPAAAPSEDPDPEEAMVWSDAAIRDLLKKGSLIRSLSYTAKFNNADYENIYEFYKRDNYSKTINHDGEYQFVSISDGESTVYYNLPDNTGYRMEQSGDDMSLVPSMETLINEGIYTFRSMGEEHLSGNLCQVVETEDENGVLKIWIDETLGLPIKYIGTDDNGWYSLELTEILLEEPPEDVFRIPDEVVVTTF